MSQNSDFSFHVLRQTKPKVGRRKEIILRERKYIENRKKSTKKGDYFEISMKLIVFNRLRDEKDTKS